MAEFAEALRLVELTCARLCHDLGGLIGTVGQALDLASGDGSTADEAAELARQAALILMRRLRLLRIAWGIEGEALTRDDLGDLAVGLTGAPRLALDLVGVPAGTTFSPPMARLILNLLLLANESLPGGGHIRLSGGATDVFVVIEGPNAAWPAGLALCLVDAATAHAAIADPRSVQMPLTALFARAYGLRLSLLMAADHGGPAPLRLSAV